MVSISATVFDLLGTLVLRALDTSSTLDDGIRRVTRTATLDGGATVFDGGFSHADRVLTVVTSPVTLAKVSKAKYLIQTYQRVIVTCRDGGYECAAESYKTTDTTLTLRFLIIKNLTTV